MTDDGGHVPDVLARKLGRRLVHELGLDLGTPDQATAILALLARIAWLLEQQSVEGQVIRTMRRNYLACRRNQRRWANGLEPTMPIDVLRAFIAWRSRADYDLEAMIDRADPEEMGRCWLSDEQFEPGTEEIYPKVIAGPRTKCQARYVQWLKDHKNLLRRRSRAEKKAELKRKETRAQIDQDMLERKGVMDRQRRDRILENAKIASSLGYPRKELPHPTDSQLDRLHKGTEEPPFTP
jgi:hypothetical protein